MPVYKRKDGKWRVVVWAHGKAHERVVSGGRALAVVQEERLRETYGAKVSETIELSEEDAASVVWIGGAPTFVYFAQMGDDGPIKIGFSRHAGVRLRYMQSGNPARLRLLAVVPGGRLLERALHRAFRKYRLRKDGEWFEPAAAIKDLVIELSCANSRGDQNVGRTMAELGVSA